HLMPRADKLPPYRSTFKNVFARISSFRHLGAGFILEYWYGGADCFLDRCDHRGFSSLRVSVRWSRERDDTTECIDHMRFQRHGWVFSYPSLEPTASFPKSVQYFRRVLRWNAFGTNFIGDDDTGVRKRTAIVTPQHLLHHVGKEKQ